ncbi:MAG: diacylglycerol kinase family protein [Methylocystis sp.]
MRIDFAAGDSNPGAEDFSSAVTGRIVVVANPGAGNHDKDTIASVVKKLRGHGCHVEIVESHDADHIDEIARTIDARAILIAGGDGSISEAVGGLLKRSGPRPVLGVIPQGTANVLAHDLGLPSDASGLADVFLRGRVAPLHIGVANGRPFILMASAGFDAEVVRRVEKRLKTLTGKFAYAYAAAKAAFSYGNHDIEVTADDARFLAKLAVVTNSRCYGGNFVIDKETSALAPGLKLIYAREFSLLALIRLSAAMLMGKLGDLPLLERMPVRNVQLRSQREVATQVDGDVLGTTPVTVSECPETVEIFV